MLPANFPEFKRSSRARRPRLFIDFALIGWRTHVTGIPRVAYAYLQEAYALASRLGFEAIPVYVGEKGLTDARPFLIQSGLRELRARPHLSSLWHVLRAASYFLAHALRLLLVTAVLPFLVIASALFSFHFFNLWRQKAEQAFGASFYRLKDRVNRSLSPTLPFAPGDVLFMPAYWHDVPPTYYARLKARGLRICPLVHDVLPVTHAIHYRSPWRQQFKTFVLETLRRADHVYYISETTRRAVETIAAEAAVKLPAGSVVRHGRDAAPKPRRIPRPVAVPDAVESGTYALMVGSIEPKKNHLRILAAFERRWRRGESARLVVVGKIGWNAEPLEKAFRLAADLFPEFTWLESVDDATLGHLYESATVVIQASAAEGFGLPILEALSLGVPVLVNDIEVFHEIAGEHATYVDVNDHVALDHALERALLFRQPVVGFEWPTWAERAEPLFSEMLRLEHAPALALHPGADEDELDESAAVTFTGITSGQVQNASE